MHCYRFYQAPSKCVIDQILFDKVQYLVFSER